MLGFEKLTVMLFEMFDHVHSKVSIWQDGCDVMLQWKQEENEEEPAALSQRSKRARDTRDHSQRFSRAPAEGQGHHNDRRWEQTRERIEDIVQRKGKFQAGLLRDLYAAEYGEMPQFEGYGQLKQMLLKMFGHDDADSKVSIWQEGSDVMLEWVQEEDEQEPAPRSKRGRSTHDASPHSGGSYAQKSTNHDPNHKTIYCIRWLNQDKSCQSSSCSYAHGSGDLYKVGSYGRARIESWQMAECQNGSSSLSRSALGCCPVPHDKTKLTDAQNQARWAQKWRLTCLCDKLRTKYA